MDEPMNSEEQPKRDIDEVSIASDFSVIPESFCGQEEGSPVEVGTAMASGGSLPVLHSQLLQPGPVSHTAYGKVIFQNLQATYTADTDIAVSYVLTDSVVGKSSDRVALYRVGFTSPRDYLSYQWAPTPTRDHCENELPLTVVFKASSLPKEAGEFFQFCYVTHEGRIVGVSTPLQLLPVGGAGGEVCGVLEDEEVEGADSMIVVRTNESVLHDKINKLDREKESLLGDVRRERETKEELKRELEEKTQQLNMCQHHLQALETKMKKETGEKCELMGRIGQVVEEKGYLEDKLRTLERLLDKANTKITTLQAQYDQASADGRRMEEELLAGRKEREQLDHSLTDAREGLKSKSQKLVDLEAELEKTRNERDESARELEFWTTNAAADQTEKNSLALKYTTVNEELIKKLEELEQSKREYKDLEQKLADAVVEMTSLKQRVHEAEEDMKAAKAECDTHRERQEVVGQDNVHLQATITELKTKIDQLTASQKREVRGRVAAETIASDLSGRLQKARAEYQALALTNIRLAKKVKKLRAAMPADPAAHDGLMSASVTSNVSSWLRADVDAEGTITEATVEGAIAEGEEETDLGPITTTSEPGVNMARSFLGSELHSASETGALEIRTVCTSCTNSTRELSEAVHRKMEDIVKELSLQITSLKSQLRSVRSQVPEQAQDETNQEENTLTQEAEAQMEADRQQGEEAGEQQTEPKAHQAEAVGQQVKSENHEEQKQAAEGEEESDTSRKRDERAANVAQQRVAEGEKQVLYGNTFLPTAPTAPVFLPEPCPSQVTHHLPQDTGSSPAPTQPFHAPSQPQYHLPASQGGCTHFLPPPLQPETTATAIQAAVMSQFVAPPNPAHTESDDDDFHSTSDNNDATPLNNTTTQPQQQPQQPQGAERNLLECPLCSLSFPVATMRLLEEHIHSHLEYVCPVCSVAFQRNSQKKFEEHVHAHFTDEDGNSSEEWTNPLDDPSGPWGQQFRSARLLEID